MATRTVDELIVLAVQTDTILRIFDGEVHVYPDPSLDASTLPEFREARCLIARRLMDLFGAENAEVDYDEDNEDSKPRRRTPEEAEAERQEELRLQAIWNERPRSVPAAGVKQTVLPPPRTPPYSADRIAGEQDRAAPSSLTDPSVASKPPSTSAPTPEVS